MPGVLLLRLLGFFPCSLALCLFDSDEAEAAQVVLGSLLPLRLTLSCLLSCPEFMFLSPSPAVSVAGPQQFQVKVSI